MNLPREAELGGLTNLNDRFEFQFIPYAAYSSSAENFCIKSP